MTNTKEPLSDQEFAARMRAARALLRLNLREAGELFGHSQQGMSRRESGEVAIPASERYHFAGIYLELTGLPGGWFTQPRDEVGNES